MTNAVSLTPVILDLADRGNTLKASIDDLANTALGLQHDISRMYARNAGPTVVPADDPRLVTIRKGLGGVADAVDGALKVSGMPTDWWQLEPYPKGAASLRNIVHGLERSKDVNLHGLNSRVGHALGNINVSNVDGIGERTGAALNLLRNDDGTTRDIDAAGIDQLVGQYTSYLNAFSTYRDGFAETVVRARGMVDRRNPNDYRDDVIYTADLMKNLRPTLIDAQTQIDAMAGALLPGVAGRTHVSEQASGLARRMGAMVGIINAAEAAGAHTVPAHDFTSDLYRISSDMRDHGSLSPANAAGDEQYSLTAASTMALDFLERGVRDPG